MTGIAECSLHLTGKIYSKFIMKIKLVLFMLVCTVCFSCKQQNPNITKVFITLDSLKFKTYADTIVCDMVVKRNPNNEDILSKNWLTQLRREALTDSIFDDVYKGKLLAYDYETQKQLSVDEVKKIESKQKYSRGIVGKYQFQEAWYYDKQNHTFIKKVHSIIFGYEIYDETGFVKGYKPLFKVKF